MVEKDSKVRKGKESQDELEFRKMVGDLEQASEFLSMAAESAIKLDAAVAPGLKNVATYVEDLVLAAHEHGRVLRFR